MSGISRDISIFRRSCCRRDPRSEPLALIATSSSPVHTSVHANLEIGVILANVLNCKSLIPRIFSFSGHPHAVELTGSNPVPPNGLRQARFGNSAGYRLSLAAPRLNCRAMAVTRDQSKRRTQIDDRRPRATSGLRRI